MRADYSERHNDDIRKEMISISFVNLKQKIEYGVENNNLNHTIKLK